MTESGEPGLMENYKHWLLIVDDEENIGKLLCRLLGNPDVGVVCASSGESGLEEIYKAPQPFSLIISDQQMPGIKGYEFFRKSLEFSPDSIRFLMTGFEDVDDAAKAVNQGHIHKILQKPWDNDALISMVEQALRMYESALNEKAVITRIKLRNKQLYHLKRILSDRIHTYGCRSEKLDLGIHRLKKKIKQLERHSGSIMKAEYDKTMKSIFKQQSPGQERLDLFYTCTVSELHEQLKGVTTSCNIHLSDEELWRGFD